MQANFSVLIVEDHPIISDGIASIVRSLVPEAQIHQRSTFQEALALCKTTRFQQVFLDLRLPDVSGFQALEAFRAELPGTPIAVMSGEDDAAVVMRCLQMGARAFIPKSLSAVQIEKAIAQVLQGGMFAPDGAMAQLSRSARLPDNPDRNQAWGLTARQIEVATLLVDGMPNKLIADRLKIAESTVKLHVSSILRQMRVTNRSQAILLLARTGLKLPIQPL